MTIREQTSSRWNRIEELSPPSLGTCTARRMHMQRHLPFVLRNAGSLLALSGGILALCAFFFLPFLSIEIWIAPHPRSTIFSVHNVAVTGAQVASNSLPALPLHPGEGIVNSGY